MEGRLIEKVGDNACDLTGEERGHRVSNLLVLLCARPLKKIVVREGLESCSLADGQASTLRGIVVDEVVAVLGNVGGHRAGRVALELDPEAIIEFSGLERVCDVLVVRQEVVGEVVELG